ncbi:DUF2339 domain-containing protein [Methylocapsa sp. S129]|uniref:DUF2339 domain-containing protein n=1 Tax=Methylocapsa sp. S129 TaxID=1641869 RepID=UPI00131E0CA7|nr:DUF2339 domain-containing protein [Methylocapsa sp. S129]
MDDFILLGLIGIVFLLLGPIGFFLTLGARSRLRNVEAQLATLLARAPAQELVKSDRVSRESAGAVPLAPTLPLPPKPDSTIETMEQIRLALTKSDPQPASASEGASTDGASVDEAATTPAPAASEPVDQAVRLPAAPVRKIGIEERLGAHWAVIVGGVALAFGALLLVKYSIEQGFFGPGLRVAGGLLLALALVAAGEYLRRKERPGEEAAQAAPIPSVLTGAGTVAAFGSLYAAHALYGFIGPGPAFLLMGVVGVATMFAAALHGPALAGLGLIGALGAPLLVTSTEPNPWPVVPYVAIVCAAAYGLARIRRWLWLAIAAAIGAAIWQGLFLLNLNGINSIDFTLASFAHLVIETALVIVVFALTPHWMVPQGEQRTDSIASEAMLGCAAIACLVLGVASQYAGSGPGWIVAAALVAAMLGLTGTRLPAVAAASAAAGLVILAALASWGTYSGLVVDPYSFFAQWPTMDAERLFVSFGLIASIALSALSFWRLLSPTPLSFAKSAIYAGAGALTPLAAVSILYLRLTHFEASAPLAAVAAGIAAAMAVGAAIFMQRRTERASPAIELGLGALAAGAIAALSLGFVFELSEGTLTVALALAALGCALVADRLAIPALRWCVLGLGLAVAGRFLYEPRIVGDALGKTIIFNWLLFGYGVPALAFGLAARIMRRSAEDAPMRVAQALSILCSALLVSFEIRHALNSGDPFAPTSGLIEQGLFAIVGILFSAILMELNARRADPLYFYASLGFGALTLAQALAGLLLWQNPYISGEPVEGGGVFNGLVLGYLLPAAAAAILAIRARGRPPEWRRMAAAAAAILLLFAYVNLELRRLFQGGPAIGYDLSTSDGEFYAYSALWLGLGILLLAYGIVTHSKPARLASAALVSLTVVKVFLLDLAGLEGVLRALSFLGLGAALIGIGLVYQKLVFAHRPEEDAEAKTAAPPAEI